MQKKIVVIGLILLGGIYTALYIFPVHAFYEFTSMEETEFHQNKTNVVEIPKKFILLTGPSTLWAVKTQNGHDVYNGFPGLARFSNTKEFQPDANVDLRKTFKLEKDTLRTMNPDLKSLDSLTHLPFTTLWIPFSGVENLAGFEGKRLKKLFIFGTKISDLSPVRGMPLTLVNCSDSLVNDLSALSGTPVQNLVANDCPITDIKTINEMKKLNKINIINCPVSDISPISKTDVTEIEFGYKFFSRMFHQGQMILAHKVSFDHVKNGMDELRKNSRITSINSMEPSRFWERYDSGAFSGGFSEMDLQYNGSDDLNDFLLFSSFGSEKDPNTNEIKIFSLKITDVRQLPLKTYRIVPQTEPEFARLMDYNTESKSVLLSVGDKQGWVEFGSVKPQKDW